MKRISYMAKITFKDKSCEVGENTRDDFESLGINFDCQDGICGICKVKVLEGMENINSKTQAEEDFPLEDGERLSCQCHEIKGDIVIDEAEW